MEKCDTCGKPAKYNLQNWWNLYEIDGKGEYEEISNWEGDTNEFYCEKCAEKEEIFVNT